MVLDWLHRRFESAYLGGASGAPCFFISKSAESNLLALALPRSLAAALRFFGSWTWTTSAGFVSSASKFSIRESFPPSTPIFPVALPASHVPLFCEPLACLQATMFVYIPAGGDWSVSLRGGRSKVTGFCGEGPGRPPYSVRKGFWLITFRFENLTGSLVPAAQSAESKR